MDDRAVSESPALAGRYALGSILGQGGMGTVREATDVRLGRRVAVKILRPDLAEQAPARRRFETEARAAARLSHPNVVMVFDSGEDDAIPFLVMELLPGRTLADEVASGPSEPERIRMVGREILAALAAAHSAGIIHRDIKPANVLLTESGHVKVSDFGIAKTIDDVDQTQTVELVASPAYLAPERLSGEHASQHSDLYSVGVLLYEALSGRRPFEGETPSALMRAIERGDAPPLASLGSALPADIVAAVERAMSLEPATRFDSAIDMAAALEPPQTLDPATTTTTTTVGVVDGTETVPVERGRRDASTRILHLPGSPQRADHRSAAPVRRRLLALAIGLGLTGVLVATVAAGQSGTAHRDLPAGTAPVAVASTPKTTSIPPRLDAAIRRLEQSVAK